MFIDIVVLVLLIMAVFKGLRNGLVMAVFSLLAFIIGITAAVKLSAVAAACIGENVSISQRWLPVLAFAAVFILVVLLVRLGAKALEGVLRVAMLGWLNRIGGVVLYMVLYLFVLSILVFYAEHIKIIKPQAAEASVAYPFIQALAPKFINALGTILPFLRDMFSELDAFFGGEDLPGLTDLAGLQAYTK
jgi:membrane protein required for colicin V production